MNSQENSSGNFLKLLRVQIVDRFNPEEFDLLCFNLNIPEGQFLQDSLSARCLALISYVTKRGFLQELLSQVIEMRDGHVWPEIPDSIIETQTRIRRSHEMGLSQPDEADKWQEQKQSGNTSLYPRIDYQQKVQALVDGHVQKFVGRQQEMALIAEFAQRQAPGYLLIRANDGYGKTALVAAIVRQHQTKVTEPSRPNLFYYFVPSHSKREPAVEFLRALNSQLLDHLGQEGGIAGELQALASQFTTLWDKAQALATATNPLLLLIDSLPDDNNLARFLPDELSDYVHVVATTQLYTDMRLLLDAMHPLRRAEEWTLAGFTVEDVADLLAIYGVEAEQTGDWAQRIYKMSEGHPLFSHSISQEVAREGQAALNRLEENPPNDVTAYFRQQFEKLTDMEDVELTWDIWGLAVTAFRGLTLAEIVMVLDVPLWRGRRALEPIRHLFLEQERLTLRHPQLLEDLADEQFSQLEIKKYRQRLLQWCQSYQERGWPDDTPEYVFAFYAEHLEAERQIEALYALIDERWITQQLKRAATYEDLMEDINLTFHTAVQETPVNWVQLIRNGLLAVTTSERANLIPPTLLGVLVRNGKLSEAKEYALLMPEASKRIQADCAIGQALWELGEQAQAQQYFTTAEAMLERLDVAEDKAWALYHIVTMYRAIGAVNRATRLMPDVVTAVTRIPSLGNRIDYLAMFAPALLELNQQEKVQSLIDNLRTTIDHLESPVDQLVLWQALARGLASMGFAELAAAVLAQARGLADMFMPAEVVPVDIAVTEESVPTRSLAEIRADIKAAAELTDQLQKATIWAETAVAWHQLEPQSLEAHALAQQAATIAETTWWVLNKERELTSLAYGALVCHQRGDYETATQLAAQAVQKWEETADKRMMADANPLLALVWTVLGNLEKAKEALQGGYAHDLKIVGLMQVAYIVGTTNKTAAFSFLTAAYEIVQANVSNANRQAEYLRELALAHLRWGNHEQAIEIAEQIKEPQIQASTLGKIAMGLATEGEPQQHAVALADTAKTLASNFSGRPKAKLLAEVGRVQAQLHQDDAEALLERALAEAENLVGIFSTSNEDLMTIVESRLMVAAVWGQAGKLEVACDLLMRSSTDATRISDKGQRAWLLAKVARGFWQVGKEAEAQRVVNLAIESVPWSTMRDRSLIVVVQALAEILTVLSALNQQALLQSHLATALNYLNSVIDPYLKYTAQNSLYRAVSKIENWWSMIAYLENSQLNKLSTLLQVAYVAAQQPDGQGQDNIRQMIAAATAVLAQPVPAESGLVGMLVSVNSALIQFDEQEQARRILRQASDYTRRHSALLETVVYAWLELGAYDQVFQTLLNMDETPIVQAMYGKLLEMGAYTCAIQTGAYDLADDVLVEMADDIQGPAAYQIVDALLAAGQQERAELMVLAVRNVEVQQELGQKLNAAGFDNEAVDWEPLVRMTHLLTDLAVTCYEVGQVQAANELAEMAVWQAGTIGETQTRQRAIQDLAISLAAAGGLATVLEAALGKLIEPWFQIDTLLEVTVALTQAKIVSEEQVESFLNRAVKGIELLPNHGEQVLCGIGLARAYAYTGKVEAAQQLANKLAEERALLQEFSPLMRQYLATTLAKAGDLQKARQVIGEAENSGHRQIMFQSVASELIADSKLEESLYFIKLIDVEETLLRVLPELATAVSSTQTTQNSAKVATELIRIAEGNVSDWQKAVAMGQVAVALQQKQEGKKAQVIATWADELLSHIADSQKQTQAAITLAGVWGSLGQPGRSLAVLDKYWDKIVEVPALQPELLPDLAVIYARLNDEEMIQRVVKSIESQEEKVRALHDVMTLPASIEVGRCSLLWLESYAEDIEDGSFLPLLGEVLQTLVGNNYIEIAEQLVKLNRSSEGDVYLRQWFIAILVSSPYSDRVLPVLQETADSNGRLYLICYAAKMLAASNKAETASQVIQTALPLNLDDANKENVAFAYAHLGEFEQALAMIDSIQDGPFRTLVWGKLASFLAECNHTARLSDIVAILESPDTDRVADDEQISHLLRRAIVLEKLGNRDKRDALLLDAPEGFWEVAQDMLPKLYAGLGAHEAAQEMVAEIRDSGARDDVLLDIALGYAALGLYSEAKMAINGVQDNAIKLVLQKHVANKLLEEGYSDLALTAVEDVSDPTFKTASYLFKAETYIKIAEHLKRNGQAAKAAEALRAVWLSIYQRVDRLNFLNILQQCAALLADIDEGETLWRICLAIMDIDSWSKKDSDKLTYLLNLYAAHERELEDKQQVRQLLLRIHYETQKKNECNPEKLTRWLKMVHQMAPALYQPLVSQLIYGSNGLITTTVIQTDLELKQAEANFRFFDVINNYVEQRPFDPNVDKEELRDIIKLLEKDMSPFSINNSQKANFWLSYLSDIAPDVHELVISQQAVEGSK